MIELGVDLTLLSIEAFVAAVATNGLPIYLTQTHMIKRMLCMFKRMNLHVSSGLLLECMMLDAMVNGRSLSGDQITNHNKQSTDF